MSVPILSARTEWICPNCKAEDVTNELRVHTRMHTCPKLGMLTAPMVPKGMDCKVVAREREDYQGNEIVTKDENGKAIMLIETVRADGSNDVAWLAPCVRGRGVGLS